GSSWSCVMAFEAFGNRRFGCSHLALVPLLSVGLGFGCGTDSGGDDASSGGDGFSNTGSAEGLDTGASSDSGVQEDDDDGPRLDQMVDTGENGTAEAGGEEGCKAVDFLFVIDNSGSMGDNQDALVASFGSFMQSIL